MKTIRILLHGIVCVLPAVAGAAGLTYPIVDTGQERCYDARGEIPYPTAGTALSGQDACYEGAQPAYRDNGDGTVSDLVTGLMWVRDPGAKVTYERAVAGARTCRVGGHADWRLPTIKELYSLIRFDGTDPSVMNSNPSGLRPFLDASVFKFSYGRGEDGDRIIDSQFATCTKYVGRTMGGNETMFGVNFADGRIKGYPSGNAGPRGAKTYYVLHVRGNPAYGRNRFRDNRNGTVTDEATGLTWQQADSGKGMDWAAALAYAEGLVLAGRDDWRLPNAKELQSLVDYTRSPDTTKSAAIDPLLRCTAIRNEAGEADFPCYWTGTSHVSSGGRNPAGVYVAFGRAMGFLRGRWMDVHGAGCQRSDPKAGDPAAFPEGRGPQGDAVRILNFVRCVRGGSAVARTKGPPLDAQAASDGRGGDAGPGPGGFVRRLDRDGDGKVSAKEFDGPPDHFPHLDRDHDGFLTDAEAPPPPGDPRRPRR
jgi:hypothetical protein